MSNGGLSRGGLAAEVLIVGRDRRREALRDTTSPRRFRARVLPVCLGLRDSRCVVPPRCWVPSRVDWS